MKAGKLWVLLLLACLLLSFPPRVMAEDTEAAEDEAEQPCKFPTEILYSERDETNQWLRDFLTSQMLPHLKRGHVNRVETSRYGYGNQGVCITCAEWDVGLIERNSDVVSGPVWPCRDPVDRKLAEELGVTVETSDAAPDIKVDDEWAKSVTTYCYSAAPRDSYRLGVSVLNENQQQVPGLEAAHFKVFIDNVEVERSMETFKVRQSKNVFTEAAQNEAAEGASLGGDPVRYDVYFALDLTESMADFVIEFEQVQMRSKIKMVANKINQLRNENLFGSNDEVYISGFTSELESGFMTGRSDDRSVVRDALKEVVVFEPQGNDAALYHAMDWNMEQIRKNAQSYTGEERRQAVLIVVTDSFNGMTMDAGRRVHNCRDNEKLTEQIVQSVRETSEATSGNFTLYMLAVGNTGETSRYRLEGELHPDCSIRSTQQEVVDTRSFRAITSSLQGGRDSFMAGPEPIALLKVVQARFENLRRAYEVIYRLPEGVINPKKFKVTVELGEDSCSDELIGSSGLFSNTSLAKLRPQEVALLLASLLLASLLLAFLYVRFKSHLRHRHERRDSMLG